MLGFLHLPKNKENYSHVKAINIISMEWMEQDGTIKCKSTLGFGITTSIWRGSATETLLMEIDAKAFKILALLLLCGGHGGNLHGDGYGGGRAVGLRHGGYGVCVRSLGSSPLYIGSMRPPNDPLVVPYNLGEVREQTEAESMKKCVCFQGFRRPEPAVRGTYGRTRL
jgi:hypothetical protein